MKSFYNLANSCNDILFWETDSDFAVTFLNKTIDNNYPKDQIGKELKKHLLLQSKLQSNTKPSKNINKLELTCNQKKHQINTYSISGRANYIENTLLGYYGVCSMTSLVENSHITLKQIKKLAYIDPLTKLYNRRWCEKKLNKLLYKKQKSKISFLFFNIDNFKAINGFHGHSVGDRALRYISKLLLKIIGKNSHLSRLSGDEFGLILKTQNNGDAIHKAQEISESLSEHSFKWQYKIYTISMSIGLALVEENDDFNSILTHASEACYNAKKSGQNNIAIYNPNSNDTIKSKEDLKWYNILNKALKNDQFELWCQPIYNSSKEISHYEILLRLIDDSKNAISPSLFMGAAYKYGLIYEIDKKVIELFCQFYKDNHTKINDIKFSINLSGHSLSYIELLPFILDYLEEYAINYNNICFEITESEIINNLEMALIFINVVRNYGCKISLDDFGKGQSGLSYLKEIPFDYIKIDGNFIKGINNDKINKAIIESIIHIAEVMKKPTIAEYIEDKFLFNQIKSMGVDFFQGYYLSHPHKITEILK